MSLTHIFDNTNDKIYEDTKNVDANNMKFIIKMIDNVIKNYIEFSFIHTYYNSFIHKDLTKC